jgi:competence protein ComEC
MTGFYKIVQFFALFPYAELHLASPSIFYLILFYVALMTIYFFPNRPRLKLSLMIMVFLLPLWCYFGPRIHFPSNQLQVTFLDVGQGDSTFVEFPDRTTLLVDGGGKYHEFDLGRLVIAPFLWNKGIAKIDYLVATHPQADHIGGLVYLMKKFPVGEVWTNGASKDSHISKEFNEALRDARLNSRIVQDGDQTQIGKLNLTILNPNLKNSMNPHAHSFENNEGIVIKIDYNLRSILLTADIEKEAEQRILKDHPGLKVTLLKAPHHGGKSSADPDFINGISPEMTLFSAGLHNPYHHPNPETLLLYQQIHSRIYRTDRDGSLFFKTDGDQFSALPALDLLPRKVTFGMKLWEEERENWSRVLTRNY